MFLRHLSAILLLSILIIPQAPAQGLGFVAGRVTDDPSGESLPGVNVVVSDTPLGAATDASGRFLIGPLPGGIYELRASFLGYAPSADSVRVMPGDTVRVAITLRSSALELTGIQVSALRPDLQPEGRLADRAIREANPRDSGELMRNVAGVDAVRRGPVGLDPVVRGLRETEVGVYLDGTRIFPGGPARMDSPLSHLDPSAIRAIEVVKGPYALTWGAGNLSAVRVDTYDPWAMSGGPVNGRVQSGYDSNFAALEEALSIHGRFGVFGYQVHGAFREGGDYASGSGASVPADFRSWEVRGTAGVRPSPNAQLTVAGGYQQQDDVDYPGRLLNADYFKTYNLSARYEAEFTGSLLRGLEALAYVNDVDHGMDNAGKPTAEADPNRMPPFPIDVRVNSGVNVLGGRLAARLGAGDAWDAQVGADLYSAYRNAVRRIWRNDDQRMLLFEDLMWPEARITDGGLFARLERMLGNGVTAAGTVRADAVWARADTATAFFRENVSADLDQTELNLSAAAVVSAAPSDHLSVSAAVGSAVRTADATERFADRIPASKAQTSAEFVGTPELQPERSTQVDLWLEAAYPRVVASLNGFARRIDDYITLEATDLPKRLPLSPETVYRYVNGEAVFYGAEARLAYAVSPAFTAEGRADVLWGKDVSVDEPALGVAPARLGLGLRYEPNDGRFFLEGLAHLVTQQDRVASTRGELPTDGYVTADVKGGIELLGRATLQVGVTNVAGKAYVNHLNAKNPFTGMPLPEPGRVFFTDVVVTF